MEFSEKLVLMRRSRGMTQTQLAEALGVTRQSVYKWERGDSYPEAQTLFAMKGLFDISIDIMLDPAYELAQPERQKPVVISPVASDTPTEPVNEETKAEPMPAPKEEKTEEKEPAPGTEKKKRGFWSRFFR